MKGDIKPNIQFSNLISLKQKNKKLTKRSYNRCCRLMESSLTGFSLRITVAGE